MPNRDMGLGATKVGGFNVRVVYRVIDHAESNGAISFCERPAKFRDICLFMLNYYIYRTKAGQTTDGEPGGPFKSN